MKLLLISILVLLTSIITVKDEKSINKLEDANWMSKNLNVSTFRNGDEILEIKTSDEWEKAGQSKTPAFCYYKFDSKNETRYGKLYNWYAVNDERELAPNGWHIASDAEWDELVKNNGGTKQAGKVLNSDEFSSISGGFIDIDGSFNGEGFSAYYWTSTIGDPFFLAFNRQIYANNDEISRGSSHTSMGYSVRCLEDIK